MLHAIYELAMNADVQERLFKSLFDETKNLNQSSSDYFDHVVNKAIYLDAFLKETLRKYPPLNVIHRRVKTDGYKLNGLSLPKDTIIEISSYAVHHNPEYYPNPDQFLPERFLPENKHKLIPYSYLPFSDGPRACVGMRFALQEMKLCIAKLVLRYRFAPTDGTPQRPEFIKGIPFLGTKTFPVKILMRK